MVRAIRKVIALRNGNTGKANPVSVALQLPSFRKKTAPQPQMIEPPF
jgi:hypothetical protein